VIDTRGIGDMDLRSNRGLTYMHYLDTPLYPFGFGMAYTNWSIAMTSRQIGVKCDSIASDFARYYSPAAAGNAFESTVKVGVIVSNIGQRASAVVVEVFLDV
jgi:hypothetical protein